MTGEARYDTYTVSTTVLRAFWLAMGLGAVAVAIEVLSDDAGSAAATLGFVAAFLVIVGLLVAWAYRSATVTTPEHLTVRGLFRTRRIPWSRVQAIMIEINPGAIAEGAAPKRIAVAYDATGRRVPLPHLNEKTFARRYGSLESEVDNIRAAWLAGRGEGWTPVAHAQAKAADMARYGVNSWAVGLMWASLTLPVVAIVFVTGLIVGVDAPWPWSLMFLPEALLVVPIVVFFVAAVASLIARRRARTRATGRPSE
jgi:hypothetical protein